MTAPPSLAPRERPDKPTNVLLMTLSGSALKVVWSEPLHDGGAVIDKYRIEWDTDTAFSYSHELPAAGLTSPFHYNIPLPAGSENKPRFVRVKAHNIVGHSDPAASTPASLAPTVTAPASRKAYSSLSCPASVSVRTGTHPTPTKPCLAATAGRPLRTTW